MRFTMFISMLCLTLLSGCGEKNKATEAPRESSPAAMDWPKDWTPFLGKTVTVVGTAFNSKTGAYLVGSVNTIYIDGKNFWPDSVDTSGDKSPKLRVTGTVIKRDDVPVFISKPGEDAVQGVPVETKEQAEKEKCRFLLKDAKWEVVK